MPEFTLPGEPTILIVDDEELMREVIAIMIEDNGGTVLEAESGFEALDYIKRTDKTIDCIIIDITMPDMGGYETYCAIQKINPAVPVILVSGRHAHPEILQLKEQNAIGFLTKPFREAELLQALENRLTMNRKES